MNEEINKMNKALVTLVTSLPRVLFCTRRLRIYYNECK